MPTIKLLGGHSTIVDADDYERLSCYSWRILKGKCGVLYAARSIRPDGKYQVILMHRDVLENPEGIIDHKNGDGLDNRKENLRACSNAENMMNQKKLQNLKL